MIHSYPWYMSDWQSSETRLRLTMAERGLYRELLDWLYSSAEGSLPDDERMVARIAGCDLRSLRYIWPAVRAALVMGPDGRLHHHKVDQIRQRIDSWHEQRREAGAAGGRVRAARLGHGQVPDSYPDSSQIAHDDEDTSPRPTAREVPKESIKVPSNRLATVKRVLKPSSTSTTTTKDLDPDCPPSRQNGGSADVSSLPPSIPQQYPDLKKMLTQYMQGQVPTDRLVVDVVEAAGGEPAGYIYDALLYLHNERGLRYGTDSGPQSWAWFPTMIADFFRKKRRREEKADLDPTEVWDENGERRPAE